MRIVALLSSLLLAGCWWRPAAYVEPVQPTVRAPAAQTKPRPTHPRVSEDESRSNRSDRGSNNDSGNESPSGNGGGNDDDGSGPGGCSAWDC